MRCDRRWCGTFCSGAISAGNMNERGRERTAAGLGSFGRRWAGEGIGGEGGLSPYFNSNLKRVLAGKHLPCSSATPIHILILPQSCFILETFTH